MFVPKLYFLFFLPPRLAFQFTVFFHTLWNTTNRLLSHPPTTFPDSDFVPSGARTFGQLFGRSDLNLAASTSVIEGLTDEQHTSPVRRTFLLVLLFDLLLCFILWIIYAQQSCGNITEALHKEVVEYTFQTSLFDTLILAFFRFLVIEIVYGAFTLRTPWWSAAVTGVTCVLLVTKCFLFDFHQPDNTAVGLVYTLIIAALVLSWIETSFLIYRVIPQEKAAAHVATCFPLEDGVDETQSLLGGSIRGFAAGARSTYTASCTGYYTPVGSYYGPVLRVPTKSNREAAVDIAALMDRAATLRSEVWYLYGLDAWGPTSDTNPRANSVRSAALPSYGHKLSRLEAVLDASPQVVYQDLVYNSTDTAWNPTIDYVESIQSLPSENIDIMHNVLHEILGGTISRRDMVLLRHWGEHEDCYFVGATSVEHPKCPPMRNCVRAQQLISAFVLVPIADKPNQCQAVWIMATDMKLFLPQRLIDRATVNELSNLLISLQTRAKHLATQPIPAIPSDVIAGRVTSDKTTSTSVTVVGGGGAAAVGANTLTLVGISRSPRPRRMRSPRSRLHKKPSRRRDESVTEEDTNTSVNDLTSLLPTA